MTIRVKGYVNASGELRAKVPEGYPEGEIEFDLPEAAEPSHNEAESDGPIWSLEELHELLKSEPQSGAEIANAPEVGSWAHLGIRSGQEWVDEVRRQARERRRWRRD